MTVRFRVLTTSVFCAFLLGTVGWPAGGRPITPSIAGAPAPATGACRGCCAVRQRGMLCLSIPLSRPPADVSPPLALQVQKTRGHGEERLVIGG
jgi:hypothetical protein